MTAPAPAPSKAKAYVALIGSLLSVGIPILLQVSTSLPPEWQAVIGGVVALLTMAGVYRAPYLPKSTAIVSLSSRSSGA